MGTADKLLYLHDTKVAIKNAIVAKGVTVATGTTFRDYATKIGEITTGGGGSETAEPWVRPTEWLALPDNVDGVQKVSILNAVFDTDSELLALQCQGAYTVDWGDGTTENFASGAKAEHKYNYNNASLNSDTVANFGYKQCIITITPQSGQNLTQLLLNAHHSTIGSSASYDMSSGFLDVRINTPFLTDNNSLSLGSSGVATSNNYVKHSMLEQCLIGELGVTSLAYLFYDCYSLQSVSIKDTSNVISFTSMHYNNHSLHKMPTYTFRSAGVSVNSMFYNCYSLIETYPLVITPSAAGSVESMFTFCKSLKYIDLTINSNINYSMSLLFSSSPSLETINLVLTGTGKVTNLGNTFAMNLIKSSPVIDTSLCTSFLQTFQNCPRLTDLYEYDYGMAITLSNMLDGCYSLKSVPNFNITASCTSLASLCNNCWSLEKAPTFSDSSGVTNIVQMLATCKSLTVIPNYIFGNISGGMSSTFSGCDSLQIMPNIAVGNVYTGNTNFVQFLYSLKRMLMPLRFTFSVANAKMSAAALTEMYSILPTVATTQTVTVTGNYGATSTPIIGLTGTTTNGSKVISMANTTGLSVGMFASGTSTSTTGFVVTLTTGVVSIASHGLINGDIVSFSSAGGVVGITLNTIYYVVNADIDTFQISLSVGGPAIVVTGNGGATCKTPAFITAINSNTNVTISTPVVNSGGTYTLSFRSNTHKTYLATMKNWTVTG